MKYHVDWEKLRITINKSLEEMRYRDVGDWRSDKNVIEVLDISEPDKTLVVIHELVEWIICGMLGKPEQEVFEEDVKGEKSEEYKIAHQCAIEVEKLICKVVGIDFDEYDRRIEDKVRIRETEKRGK